MFSAQEQAERNQSNFLKTTHEIEAKQIENVTNSPVYTLEFVAAHS